MTNPAQVLSTGKDAVSLCDAAEISPEARALLGDGVAAKEFTEQLIADGHFSDAIAFLAHALPRREAIWWAMVCARAAVGQEPEEPVHATLEIIRQWIAEPTDEHRRQAFQMGEALGYATPVGCATVAIFLSGETLGLPDTPPIPPEEYAGAKAIVGSVNLAALQRNQEDPVAAFQEFLAQGMKLADRARLWTPPPTPPGAAGQPNQVQG